MPEQGDQLHFSDGQRLGAVQARVLLFPYGTHWYNTSVLRLLVLANLIVVLLAVVVVLVAALVFSLPWGMPSGGVKCKEKRTTLRLW
jgi:hypothetical protein